MNSMPSKSYKRAGALNLPPCETQFVQTDDDKMVEN
jgi:hypothetical protein